MEQERQLSVLIVDDDIPLTLFIKKVITIAGHKAVVAADGAMAIAAMKVQKFDIAICDLVLPGTDGSDIIKEMKKSDPKSYGVLISGYYNESFNNYKVLSGADEVIGKPVTKEMLDDILRRYLETHSS